MVDPISLVLASAAAGGVGGKVAEKAWDVGERWVKSYFADHHEVALQQAKENAAYFIVDLAQRMGEVEKKLAAHHGVDPDALLQDPDLAASLEEAILTAARTKLSDKRALLADLVAHRALAEAEGLEALASALAIQSVKHLGPRHLKILGLMSLVSAIRPSWADSAEEAQAPFSARVDDWLRTEVEPYLDLDVPTAIELWHLDAVNCLTFHPGLIGDLGYSLGRKQLQDWTPERFLQTEHGKALHDLWDAYLNQADQTPSGYLIGYHYHQSLTGTPAEMVWPREH